MSTRSKHENGGPCSGDKTNIFGACTVRAPINIALVKYWGKKDQRLNIPLNDSISLSIDALYAETTIRVLEDDKEDSVEVNGKASKLAGTRYERIFEVVRRWEQKRDDHRGRLRFEIKSTTNFPVAAGLASSAAGFAAIAEAFQKIFGLSDSQKSHLARLGSGSAIRSIFGGLVRWRRGVREDGDDSIAEQIYPSTHWPSLRGLIFVVDDQTKEYSSTDGMQRTVETSVLLPKRLETCDGSIEKIESAFSKRDFPGMAEVIMRDSNNFHAVCLDTTPPLMYMNDSSRQLIRLVNRFNEVNKALLVAYTFDAGPNATFYLEEPSVLPFLEFVSEHVRLSEKAKNCVEEVLSKKLEKAISEGPRVLDVIYSRVGGGPETLSC